MTLRNILFACFGKFKLQGWQRRYSVHYARQIERKVTDHYVARTHNELTLFNTFYFIQTEISKEKQVPYVSSITFCYNCQYEI